MTDVPSSHLEARLKAIETKLEKSQKSELREWVAALAPVLSSIVLFFVGYWLTDSVKAAVEREQLDLDYVKDMRDLIKDFDQSTTQQASDANAIGLAMYGRHAIIPLVERLKGADVASIAAEKGLLLVGSNDPKTACPKFQAIIDDKARRFPWQTHKRILKIIGQSGCTDAMSDIKSYRAQLAGLGTNTTSIESFAIRYSEPAGFDGESVANLISEADLTLEILNAQVKP